MAIRAKQLQIALVGGPVLESPRPCVLPVFRANLFGRVNVVNVERPKVGESALNAPPTKLKYERQFAFPVAGALMNPVAVFIPEASHTRRRAKPVLAPLSAGLAISVLSPSVREVAGLPAKLCAPVFSGRLPAMFASIHGVIITKYFDIACRRIEDAQRQKRMFA